MLDGEMVIWSRWIAAFVAGCLMSLAGSLVQVGLRNPLASSSTLGFEGMVILALMMAHALVGFTPLNFSVELLAFTIGLIPLVVLLILPLKSMNRLLLRSSNAGFLLLMGLSFNLLIGAFFAVLQFLMMGLNWQFPTGLWFGQMHGLLADELVLMVLTVGVVLVGVFKLRHSLSAYSLSAGLARSLGHSPANFYRTILALAYLATLWCVSQFGVFAFMGLVFPLLLRQLPVFRGQVWKEATVGAVLAGLAFSLLDWGCYHLTIQGAELPVGMVASVVGSLTLLILLWSRVYKESAAFLGKVGQRD